MRDTGRSGAGDGVRLLRLLTLLLAGPILWSLHFAVVYLLGEAVCDPDVDVPAIGSSGLVTAIVVATVVAGLGALVFAWRAGVEWRRAPPEDGLRRFGGLAGMLLGVLFFLSILFVGSPAIAFPPC